MATKTLTITTDAYDYLATAKYGNESFSDVIIRTFKRASPRDLIGVLSHREAEELRTVIQELRKHTDEQVFTRAKRMMQQ